MELSEILLELLIVVITIFGTAVLMYLSGLSRRMENFTKKMEDLGTAVTEISTTVELCPNCPPRQR